MVPYVSVRFSTFQRVVDYVSTCVRAIVDGVGTSTLPAVPRVLLTKGNGLSLSVCRICKNALRYC